MRRTKIVATLGPASDPPKVLAALLDAGVDVVRLGLAHGSPEEHLTRIKLVRDLAQQRGRTVGVLADLPGPKVRAGTFPEGGAFLAEGDRVELVVGPGVGTSTSERIAVDEPRLAQVVSPGDTVVVGDGTVSLEVVAVDDAAAGGAVQAVVHSGGRLQGRPGVHLPSDRWMPSVPTPDDLRLLDRVGRLGDWVALSFVRRPEELGRLREALGSDGPRLMAKIETRDAVERLDDLLAVADGVMVARGDLGIDCPIEDVPHLQKEIINACAVRGIPVLTATQMLESMVSAPMPTRAEASDVANAVVDGSDALMLSAETAIGHDPPQAVRTMARIAERAERSDERRIPAQQLGSVERRPPTTHEVTVAMAHAARRAASELQLAAIVCCTRTGATARAMAALRPPCQLIGASPSAEITRQLALSWGVEPCLVSDYTTTDEMVWCVVETAVQQDMVRHGETIAVLAGAPDSPVRTTDVLRIVAVR